MAHAGECFLDLGLITEEQKGALVSAAAQGDRGNRQESRQRATFRWFGAPEGGPSFLLKSTASGTFAGARPLEQTYETPRSCSEVQLGR